MLRDCCVLGKKAAKPSLFGQNYERSPWFFSKFSSLTFKVNMFRILLLSILCFTSLVIGEQVGHKNPKNKICLNMIVKDEGPIIERCLASLKGFIDYWVIVDTGSTDGTQKIIKDFLKDIPGELHERPWVNFGHNRQEALDLARGKSDYVLFMDADEKLLFPKDYVKPPLGLACYFATFIDPEDAVNFPKILIIDSNPAWNWVGVVHEYLTMPENATYGTLNDVTCLRATSTSNRSQDPRKYHNDAKLLEEALLTDPDNSRSVFYLAQSYCNAKEYEKSLKNYQRRMDMSGAPHEAMWSSYVVGRLHEILNHSSEEIINSYTVCYQRYPNRAEPLFRLSDYFIRNKNYILSYVIAKQAMTIPEPTGVGIGYVEKWAYEYGTELLYANAAFMLGRFDEANPVFEKLLVDNNVNPAYKPGIKERLDFYKNKVQAAKK